MKQILHFVRQGFQKALLDGYGFLFCCMNQAAEQDCADKKQGALHDRIQISQLVF